MRRERRNLSGPEKMAILREHLIDKVLVSEVCERHGFQPTLFYDWQKKRFEDRKLHEAREARRARRHAIRQRRQTA